MKKSLLALAVLGAFAGVASAQSSVTLFGIVDLNGRYVKNDGTARRLSLSQDGINSSRLGFRGVEDLGGGLKAGFWLEGAVSADTGTTGSKFFGRRSTVSLISPMGELRLGRDYTPTFWNNTIYDAFGTVSIGGSLNPRQLYGGTRLDNSISYFLPSNLGGFYGQVMVAAGEGGTTADRGGRYIGGRIGFAAGPFDVSGAYGQQRFAVNTLVGSVNGSGATAFPVTVLAGETQKTWNVGGSYDFGFLKLLGYYDHESVANASEKMFSISTVIPFGQSEVHLGYDRSTLDRTAGTSKVDQIKATYQYNLSKRTAMYSTVSVLNNKNGQILSIAGGSAQTALPSAGGKSQGFEVGVRHIF